MKKKKIVFTGGTGRFAIVFRKIPIKEKVFFPKKKELNVENLNSIKKYLKKVKPGYLIHTAALSRPMDIHEKNITKSINTNIIGTANIVKACQKENIKLIYF
jgi:dTDP-4-dehydrorhamnose reductase